MGFEPRTFSTIYEEVVDDQNPGDKSVERIIKKVLRKPTN